MGIESAIKDIRQDMAVDRSEPASEVVVALRPFMIPDGSGVIVRRGTVLTLSPSAVRFLTRDGLVGPYVPPPPTPEEQAALDNVRDDEARAQMVRSITQRKVVTKTKDKRTKGGRRK